MSDTPPQPGLLGRYLSCSADEIIAAMREKHRLRLEKNTYMRLGDILVESGAITQEELAVALAKQRAERLSLCPVFKSLDNEEIAALACHFTEMSLGAREQFIMEGEHDPTLYVLVSGEVDIFKIGQKDGKNVHIATLSPYEPIGEIGYFQGGIRSASARTVTPVDLLYAAYDNLTDYFENMPHVAHFFLEIIRQRDLEAKRKIEENTPLSDMLNDA